MILVFVQRFSRQPFVQALVQQQEGTASASRLEQVTVEVVSCYYLLSSLVVTYSCRSRRKLLSTPAKVVVSYYLLL